MCVAYSRRYELGQGAKMLGMGMKGRKYRLWWSRKGDGVCGVGVMVKGELCKMVNDGVIADVVSEEDVLWLICGYAMQSRMSWKKNSLFMMRGNVSWICTLQMT